MRLWATQKCETNANTASLCKTKRENVHIATELSLHASRGRQGVSATAYNPLWHRGHVPRTVVRASQYCRRGRPTRFSGRGPASGTASGRSAWCCAPQTPRQFGAGECGTMTPPAGARTAERYHPYRVAWLYGAFIQASSSSNAALANIHMFASRSATLVSTVRVRSTGPATAIQAWPAASP